MPKTKSPMSKRIADRLARRILEILRDGRPQFNANGDPVFDDDGKIVMKPPSNADLKIALEWIKHAGVKPAQQMDPYEAAYYARVAEERIAAERTKSAGLDRDAIAGRLGVKEARG